MPHRCKHDNFANRLLAEQLFGPNVAEAATTSPPALPSAGDPSPRSQPAEEREIVNKLSACKSMMLTAAGQIGQQPPVPAPRRSISNAADALIDQHQRLPPLIRP
jgi:hypothetical protein